MLEHMKRFYEIIRFLKNKKAIQAGGSKGYCNDFKSKLKKIKVSTKHQCMKRKNVRKEDKGIQNTDFCDNLISDENFKIAIKKVRRNKGAPCIDNIPVNIFNCIERELDKKVKLYNESLSRIVARTYRSKPIKRVEILKDDGGKRLLVLTTVLDKVVQQAMMLVLAPIFEETFSDSSYDYRPKISAQNAVRQA